MAAGRHSLTRIAAIVAAGFALFSLSSEAIAASSRVCRQLEAELASAGSGASSPAQMRKQDSAIAKQRSQLQLARKQSREAGCGFSLFGRGDAKCGAVNAKIEKMERNLDALQRKRSQVSAAGSARSRSKIMAALDANGCRDDRSRDERVARRDPDRSGGLFEQTLRRRPSRARQL